MKIKVVMSKEKAFLLEMAQETIVEFPDGTDRETRAMFLEFATQERHDADFTLSLYNVNRKMREVPGYDPPEAEEVFKSIGLEGVLSWINDYHNQRNRFISMAASNVINEIIEKSDTLELYGADFKGFREQNIKDDSNYYLGKDIYKIVYKHPGVKTLLNSKLYEKEKEYEAFIENLTVDNFRDVCQLWGDMPHRGRRYQKISHIWKGKGVPVYDDPRFIEIEKAYIEKVKVEDKEKRKAAEMAEIEEEERLAEIEAEGLKEMKSIVKQVGNDNQIKRLERGFLSRDELKNIVRDHLFSPLDGLERYQRIKQSDVIEPDSYYDTPSVEYEVTDMSTMSATQFELYEEMTSLVKDAKVTLREHTATIEDEDEPALTRYSIKVEVSLKNESFSREYACPE